MKKTLFRCLCGVIVLAVSTQAWAFVSWTNASGSTASFDWANGGSTNGLYGDPTIMGGNTFVFFPGDFLASSENGGTDIVSDRLEFELYFHEGFCLSGIKITEYGDYGILGDGASVNATGMLTLQDLGNSQIINESIIMDKAFPLTSGSGTWQGVAEITDLLCANTKIMVSNELVAISSANSTSYIQKKVAGSAIAIEIIPEPATLVLLGLGALVLRRKK